MAQTIKLKRSATSGATPTTSQLELGEVAINTYDGKMYIKKNVGGTESIVEIGGSAGSSTLSGLSDVTISSAAADQLLQYNGSEWVNVSIAEASAIMKEYQFTATAGQSTFSGSDDNSETLSYTAGAIQVFLNGIFLDSAVDYTATNGTSIVLSETVDANDYLQVVAFKKKIGDGNVSVDTFTGDNSTTAFTLSVDPGDENNTRVFIDGVYQSKDNYSVSGTTLTFSTAPPTSTAIEVEIGNRVVTLDTLSDLDLPDDVKLRLGTSQDLQIYHNGSHSYIDDAGTGNLYIRNGTKNSIFARTDGEVVLYHNDSSKLQTTSSGIQVTGNIANTSGDMTLDVAGDITLDAGGGDIIVADDGTEIGRLKNVASGFQLQSSVSNKDLLFVGSDAGVDVTALTLDMSAAGTAIFNSHVDLSDSKYLRLGNDADFIIYHDGSTNYVQAVKQDSDIIFRGNDGGTNFNALTLDMSAAGAATFNSIVTANAGLLIDTTVIDSYIIRQNTSDGSDNSQLSLAGGGADSDGRGARARLYGNEHSSKGGDVDISTGNIAGAQIDMYSTGNFTVDAAGDIILDAAGNDVILKDNGTTFGQLTNDSGNLVIYNSGSQMLKGLGVGSNAQFMGNVGIGASPATGAKLHLSSTAGAPIYIEDSDATSTFNITELSNNGANFSLQTRNSSGTFVSTDYQIVKDANGANYHRWFTAGSERMRVNYNGNVGIGTVSPSIQVDVENTVANSGGKLRLGTSDSSTSGVMGRLIFGNGNDIAQSIIEGISDGATDASALVFKTEATGSSEAERMRIDSSGHLQLSSSTDNIIRSGSDSSRVRIFGGGYQSVANGAALTLQGVNHSSGNFADLASASGGYINFRNGTSNAMRIDSSGNVGIGTTSPDAKLQVAGTTMVGADDFGSYDSADGNLMVSNGSSATSILLYNDASAYHSSLINYHNAVLSLGLNNANTTNTIKTDTAINVTATGVGLGGSVITDVNLLNIQGSSNSSNIGVVFNDTHTSKIYSIQNGSSALKFYDYTANAERMRIDSSGNVGIGTNSPNAGLEVLKAGGGKIRISETASRYVEILGYAEGTANGSTMAFHTVQAGTSTSTERMRIDSSGNLLVGTTDTTPYNNSSGTGLAISSAGQLSNATHQDAAMLLNRMSTDGSIIDFKKDGSTVGSIANDSTSLVVTGSSTGLKFGSAAIWPTTGGGATNSNGAKDLGASTAKFKDAYFHGTVHAQGGVEVLGTSTMIKHDYNNLGSYVQEIRADDRRLTLSTKTNDSNAGIVFELYDAEKARFDYAGRLLIGQNSNTGGANADNLVVGTGSGNNGITILSGTANGGTLAFADADADEDGFISYNHPSQFMQFGTAATERMRINSSGNVGVGVTGNLINNLGTLLNVNNATIIGNGTSGSYFGYNLAYHSSAWKYQESSAVGLLSFTNSGDLTYRSAASGTGNTTASLSERFVIKQAGNVGIGTTSPVTSLSFGESSTGITFLSTATNFNSGKVAGIRGEVGGTGYGNLAFDTFQGGNGGGERMMIRYDGNVGIGTTSPSAKLHTVTSAVSGTARDTNAVALFDAVEGRIQVRGNDTGSDGAVVGLSTGSHNWGLLATATNKSNNFVIGYQNTSTDGNVFSADSLSNHFVISTGGNVGIGTASPTAKLHVLGGTSKIEHTNGGLVFVKAGGGSSTNSDYMAAILRTDTAGYHVTTNNGGFASVADGLAIMNHGDLFFATAPTTGGGTNYPSGRVMIKSTGNVGIGTASPEEKLHVGGKGTFENAGNVNRGNLILGPHGSGTSKWGTLVGAHYNEASGSGNGSGNAGIMMIGSHAQSGSSQVYIGHGPYEINPATHIRLGTHSSDTHNLGGTTHMIIGPSGDVGIGTTNPDCKLSVDGTISSGTTTKPTHATYDSNGNMRSFEHHFTVYKTTGSGTAVNTTLVDISGLGNFHQSSFVVEYGTRLQGVSDSTTGTVVRTYGVNRFNSGSLNLMETNAIAGSSNSITHALVTVQVVSNTQYRLRVEFSSTLGGSSFVSGVIRGYGVGDYFPTISFSEGTAGS